MSSVEMNPVFEKKITVGTRVTKPDAPDKATGKTIYINDMELPRMLYGKILHTDRVHAKIISIDKSAAEALPGVHVVLTGEDIPVLKFGTTRDNVPLKAGKVRCTRDEVAAVAAESEEIAAKAIELIKVEYEDLPPVFSPSEALKEGAPVVQEDHPDNSSLSYRFSHGDVAAA